MKSIFFFAILLTVLALAPGVAHVLELPNKLSMSAEDYLTVQSVYRGWWTLGILLFASLTANAALAATVRDEATPFMLAIGATFAVVGALVIFFVWTYPVNQATENWTRLPLQWRSMRNLWEFSHAASAAVMLIALCCSILAVVMSRRPR
jgi:hypothetical protein